MKTGYRRLERACGNKPVPQQGSGQGNGMGPTLLALISTKLITMMCRKRHGVVLLSATTLTLLSLVCFAFVDNTYLPITGRKHSRGEDLINQFQEALDRWAEGLTITGGKLAPIQLWCYLVDHVWTGTKWRYRTKEEMPGEFTRTNRHRVCHAIDCLEPSVKKNTRNSYCFRRQPKNANNVFNGESKRIWRENKIQSMHGRHSYVYIQLMFYERY